jgi:hypothetical protein
VIARLAVALLCLLADVASSVWLVLAALGDSPRFWKIAVAKDQALNAALGGDEDLTISTRAALGARQGKRHWCLLCKLLDRVEKDHCENSLRGNV